MFLVAIVPIGRIREEGFDQLRAYLYGHSLSPLTQYPHLASLVRETPWNKVLNSDAVAILKSTFLIYFFIILKIIDLVVAIIIES